MRRIVGRIVGVLNNKREGGTAVGNPEVVGTNPAVDHNFYNFN